MDHLHLIVDESGSMRGTAEAVYEGARELVDDVKPDGTVCVTRFNTTVDIGEDISAQDAKSVVTARECTGTTALYDAICDGVGRTLDRHRDASSVTIAIVTDGIENSSRSSIGSVRATVSRANERGWRVVFLGSNQDAVVAAQHMGIRPTCALTYGNTETETRSALRSLGSANRRYISGENEGFTVPERQASLDSTSTRPTIERQRQQTTEGTMKWMSLDPRTGLLAEYDREVSARLARAVAENSPTVEVLRYSATIIMDRDSGCHIQRTNTGERDVRCLHPGATIYTQQFGTSGHRITDTGRSVVVP